MDLRKLKTILDIFARANDVQEMEISEGEERLRLVRQKHELSVAVPVPSAVVPSAGFPATATPPPKPEEESSEGQKDNSATEIPAPMVGTFYTAPAPDRQPYVEVGSEVVEGDVLCIIEAMKLMNEIKSPVSGKVIEIVARNTEPVGYGDVLMIVSSDTK